MVSTSENIQSFCEFFANTKYKMNFFSSKVKKEKLKIENY